MAIQYINTGTSANSGDGDSIRLAFTKINANFKDLTDLLGSTATEVTELVQDRVETLFVHNSHTGLTAVYDDLGDKIILTVVDQGNGSIYQGDSPPTANTSTLWYDTVNGKSFVYFDGYWVESSPSIIGPTGPSGPDGAASSVPGPTGPTGSVGATGPQGPTGADALWNFLGEYDPRIYVEGDVVTYNGETWYRNAVSNSVNGYPPGGSTHLGDPPYWIKIAAKGDIGPQGPSGVAGDTGPTGPTGPEGPQGPSWTTDQNAELNTTGSPTFENIIINNSATFLGNIIGGQYQGYDDISLIKDDPNEVNLNLRNLHNDGSSQIYLIDNISGGLQISHQNSTKSYGTLNAGENYIHGDGPSDVLNIGLYSDINFQADTNKFYNPGDPTTASIQITAADRSIKLNETAYTHHIIPQEDITYDLGSPTKQWRSLYLSSSTLYVAGRALSVDANGSLTYEGSALDAYSPNNPVDWIGSPTVSTFSQGLDELASRVSTIESTPAGTGPTGPEGPQGPSGADSLVAGPSGPEGPQGPSGVNGDTGPTGPEGPQGPSGVNGDTGPTGPEGPQGPSGVNGDTGPTGPEGPQGPSGADSLVAGPEGPQGPSGPSGAGSNVNVNSTPPGSPTEGDLWYDTESGRTYIYYDSGWIDANPSQVGPQGPSGPSGADSLVAGPTGPTGPEGPQGPSGANGSNGAEGPQGVTGPQGPQGVNGADGPQGPEGPQGPQGPSGADGTSVNISGTTSTSAALPFPYGGSNGDGFITQDDGHLWVYGSGTWTDVGTIVGPVGPQGPQGPQGDTGPQGPQGPSGANGTIGVDGATGPQGPQGPVGDTGAQGPQGPTGNTGPEGPQGPVGNTGPQGPQGPQGVTGPTGPIAGSDTQVIFNDGGVAGANAGLTYNKTSQSLTVSGDISVNGGYYNTTATTAYIVNTTATTVYIAGGATIGTTIGNAAGTTTLLGNVQGSTNGFTIGYKDIPQLSYVGSTTLAATDGGKHYYSTLGTNTALTIPPSSSINFAIGTAVNVINQGTGAITITQGVGVTLYLAGNATSGNRSLAAYGMATLQKVASDTWFVVGVGLS